MPDLFAPGAAETLVLLAMRVGGMLLIAPVFSARSVPVTLRSTLLVLLSVLLFPAASAAVAGVPALTPAAAMTETLIGMAVGLGVALLVGAAEIMGEMMAIHTGLSGAASLDPMSGAHSPTLAQFANAFALALLFGMGAHLEMLGALVGTLEAVPIGGTVDERAGMGAMVSSVALLFRLGLQFALPVVAVVSLANVALAIVSRAAPQLNLLSISFPVQIALGLLALATALPMIAASMGAWVEVYRGMLGGVVNAFAGGGAS